jgi:VanZ family protein
VSRARTFFKYWFPVLIWMAVIFSASADSQSFQHSSRIIEPLLRWLFPDISAHTVGVVVGFARKCAHLTEYAILGALFWRILRKPQRNDPRPWSWREGGWSILFVAWYAGTDEFHQLFVRNRGASIRDVGIDTIGGILGMLALWALVGWRRRRRQRPQS